LHGSFVWDQVIKDLSGKQVVSSPWTRRDIAKARAVSIVNPNKENQPVSNTIAKVTESSENTHSRRTVVPPIDGLPPADG